MIVTIGTKNPVKLEAVGNIFEKVFGNIKIIAVEIDSGISRQPMNAQETKEGALKRAKEALQKVKDAHFGVGVEGGVEKNEFGLMLCGFVTVVDKDGKIGIGGGTQLLLPPLVEKPLQQGEELGSIMDRLIGEKNTKQKMGTPGILTHGLTDRKEFFKIATAYALVPFLNPELYENKK